MRFEETIDFLIEKTKDVCPNLPKKRRLDLICIGGLVEHLENKARFIKTIGHAKYTFEALMIDVENSLKEIEEVYGKKRKELGLWKTL